VLFRSIKASGGGEMLNIKSDAHLSILDMFRTRQGNLEGIGWQASDTMFIVIMSSKELSTVKDIR
jgi:hypothetical protein